MNFIGRKGSRNRSVRRDGKKVRRAAKRKREDEEHTDTTRGAKGAISKARGREDARKHATVVTVGPSTTRHHGQSFFSREYRHLFRLR